MWVNGWRDEFHEDDDDELHGFGHERPAREAPAPPPAVNTPEERAILEAGDEMRAQWRERNTF